MTLAETLQEKLSDWHTVGEGRHSLNHTVTELGWSVGLIAEHNDRVGCLLHEIQLHRLATNEPLDLKIWANGIADRVRGLLEELKVLEIDPSEKVAMLRSKTPSQKGDTVQYYEITLHAGLRAVVKRYEANRKLGTPREEVAFALTHEVLAKLVGDLAQG